MRLRSALPVAASQNDAIDRDRSAGRRDQPRQHPHRRRLAGAVGAEQRDDLALRDFEADVVDGDAGAEVAGEAMGGDHRVPASNSYSPGVTSSRPFGPKKSAVGASVPAARNWTVRILSPSGA